MRYFTTTTPRRAVTALVTSGALLGLAASPAISAAPAPAQAAAPTGAYVDLRDSFSSGPVIPPQADAVTCLRPMVNYRGLVAVRIKAAVFRDVTCSGAATTNFTTSQPANTPNGPPAPPQYDALTADTTLVTVGIGGNDVGLLDVGVSCLIATGNPTGPTCQSANGRKVERRIDAFAATYGTVVDSIRAKAPLARILLVGYPTTIRPGGCFPTQPVKPADATYLQSLINRLDRRMRDQAVAHCAEYVNLLGWTVVHDVSAPAGQEWTEGAAPLMPAFPLHPSALGMQNTAKQVRQVVRAGRGSGRPLREGPDGQCRGVTAGRPAPHRHEGLDDTVVLDGWLTHDRARPRGYVSKVCSGPGKEPAATSAAYAVAASRSADRRSA